MSLRELTSRVLGLFRRRPAERELDDEIRFHLEMETEENLRRGMSREEARRAAHVELRRRRARQGGLPRPARAAGGGLGPPGPPLRRPDAAAHPRLHRRRGGVAGPRHRRQHGDLQPGQRRPPPAAALRGLPAPGPGVGDLRPHRQLDRLGVGAQPRGLAAAERRLHRPRGLRTAGVLVERLRRAGVGGGGAAGARRLRGAGRSAAARPRLRRRRRRPSPTTAGWCSATTSGSGPSPATARSSGARST